ncbi:MAG TPA: DUF6069 family protein [Nocardioides sp.]|nr:DUF6069 family protein [Nocardioides sp.]
MTATATTPNTSHRSTSTKTGSVLLAGIAATAAALLGNTIVAQIALAAGASKDFQPLTPGAYGFFTVVGVIAGLVGWLVVRRRVNAADTLRWLVPTVLVLSLVPDVAVGFSDRAGVSWGAVTALMVMHVVVTLAAVTSFRRFLPVD